MATLYYQGHGSFRITTKAGKVIYVDPYAGDGYDLPADLVLVTHEHGDHNQLQLVTLLPGARVIRSADALVNGEYKSFDLGFVQIRAVQAYNKNHDRKACVGYVLALDGVTVYAAGDTSTTEEMKHLGRLDYALLPTDGIYNMGPEEATACAALLDARVTIPIHMKPGALFDRAAAERFTAPNRLILAAGESLELV